MKRFAFLARLLALVLVLGLVIGCFAGCSSKVTDKDDDDHKDAISETKEESPSQGSDATDPTASTSVERPLPTGPSDEVTVPSTGETAPSADATESTGGGLGTIPTLPPVEPSEPSSEATEPSTEATEPSAPDLDLTMVGKYWMYTVIEYGVTYDYQDVIEAGLKDSYLKLLADGTVEALSGTDYFSMTWDSNSMTMTDSEGTYDFTLEDGLLTLIGPDSTLVYAIDGSPLLELPEDPTDPTVPPVTDPTTEPTTEPTVEYVTLTVYSVDPNWSDLYFWGWNSETMENLSAEFPGEAMHRSGNVYTLEIPLWVDSAVLYADSCGEQSADMDIYTGGDIWIIVNLTYINILDREPTAEELEPETPGPETFTVHAYVDNSLCHWGIPYCWAWNQETLENLYAEWPGEAMTSEGGGWYTIELPATVDAIVVSGLDVQTPDFLLDGEEEVWVVCNSGDDAVAYSYEPSGSELLPPSVPETFTIHAMVPAHWENPGCWAWQQDGEDVFEEWPGEAMVKDGDWYTIEIPSWADCFIINANDGATQTDDGILYGVGDIWVLVSDEYSYYYDSVPTAEEMAEFGF